ncbi:hypothetical protein [Methylobacterium sp. E-046]|uniref:hypothetical protein n=1 Tax=Methylobacterium sp. E-046 TaxID=2836576 RepID=UPI001FBA2CF7|nr:hypothetical protein [Methylobacterium sp. E-046]MCJ2102241.1 hypothetical protein [Methylobacterium sp. E-046]
MNENELTPAAGADLLLKAEVARREFAATQAYLQRGRKFKDLSDEDLREQWSEACREWSKRGLYDRPGVYDDAEAELRLRGQPLPYDIVQDEMNTLVAEADARVKQATPEDYRKMGEQLVSQYVEEREREN